MKPILNISAYRFVGIDDPHALRDRTLQEAAARSLKGTVLLAEEGINLFLAGAPDDVRGWVAWLRSDPRFEALEPKESWSAEVPFKRLKVKVKREIIRMNHPTIRPANGRAPVVRPETLARWIEAGRDDAGREVVTLDTRNAFEVDHGAFEGAIDWRLERFSDFPAAVEAHRQELEGKTVVSYCTGGIRCEKAALYMRQLGMEHVYQLEGGILKYFEETKAPGWQGDCFVFDEREALAPSLDPRRVPDGLSSEA